MTSSTEDAGRPSVSVPAYDGLDAGPQPLVDLRVVRIRAISYQTAIVGGAIFFVILAAIASLVLRAVGVPGVAVAVFAVVVVVAGVANAARSTNRTVVDIEPSTVSWRTWTGRYGNRWATPSGSIPVAVVTKAQVVPQVSMPRKTTHRGYAVRLHTLAGAEVTLPLFTPQNDVTPPFAALVRALRATFPPQVPVDTAALGTASPLATTQP
jgi:hypothetical protein